MPPAKKATSTVALAEAARRMQVKIRNAALADIAKLWPLLNFERIDQTWQPWLRLVIPVLTKRHAMTSDQAALFYRAARQHAIGDPGPPSLPKLAAPPTEEWVARAVGYSAPHVYAREVGAGRTPEQANKSALTQTLGTTSRIVLDGARTTMQQTAPSDSAAIGWYRITDGDPCYFCALMASRVVPMDGKRRGSLYESKGSAGADANERFTGDGLFKFHNDCGCTVAPAFSHNIELDDIAKQASRIYQDRGEGDALNAFRKAWESRAR